ncbi:putative BTB/POZ domain-containing protein [Acanthamoeba polyphaga mimivirus]|uniref:BTB/POZ domain-containing protein n=1 Tax=Acanthamoeba polyphaga mimivirus Kroon TaxID=3069720 RepID=A0A0G2Y266_9VIRU|nr:putative BTB/POZ domain-containing protein [Acanthamoeba polyphaga mimivirus]AKI79823.1 putative BTB/POZ domain-containing protein [Acanthamoeba polyphaga mimivirus Kroon]
MLINKFKKDLKNKEYTDLTLILKDETCEIEMDVHKTVVCMMCGYFENFIKFNSQTKKKSNDKLTVIVPNALITSDIIRSFYDKKSINSKDPLWKYTLEKIICRDFLMLDNDLEIIKDLKIPSEGISLFLEVLSMKNYEFNLMSLLKKNISKGYNFKNMSSKIVDELYSRTKPNIIVCMGNENNLELWNIETNKLINNIKLDKHFCHTTNIVCSQYESIIAISDGQTFGLTNVSKKIHLFETRQIDCSSRDSYYGSSNRPRFYRDDDSSDDDSSDDDSNNDVSKNESVPKHELEKNNNDAIKFSKSKSKIVFELKTIGKIVSWKTSKFINPHPDTHYEYRKKFRHVINIDGFPNNKLLYFNRVNKLDDKYEYMVGNIEGKLKKTINFEKPIKIAKYLPNGKCIVLVSEKKIMLTNKKFIEKISLDMQNNISSVCCSPCNRYIIIASGNNYQDIYYLSAKNLEILFKFKAHDDSIVHLASTLDGKYIVSSGLDGLIKIWNFKTANLSNVLPKRDVHRMKFDIMENMWLDIAESIDISFDVFNQS